MRIRLQMLLVLILVGLIPALIMYFIGRQEISSIRNTAVNSNQTILLETWRSTVRSDALSVSKQIKLYLDLYPEVNVNDLTLTKSTVLDKIAVQPIGTKSYTAVWNAEGIVIFHQDSTMVGMDLSTLQTTLPEFWAIVKKSLSGAIAEGPYTWNEPDGTASSMFMVVQPIEGTPLRAAALVYTDEELVSLPPAALPERISSTAATLLGVFTLLFAILSVITLVVGTALAFQLANPIEWMASTANQALRVLGNISKDIQLPERKDEVTIVSYTLGVVSKQVQEAVANLEKQVNTRTAELVGRTAQLEAAAQVARESAAILDVEQLLNQTTQLISQRFGFYHIGIFLIDDAGEYALLRSTNSEGGRRMLERGHKLRVGQVGIVGFAATRGEPRIVANVDVDETFLRNPDLPQTRSEMALPLKVRGKVTGVLDVQSTAANAFAEDDVRIVQILADQLALAIENARLLRQGQEAYQELNVLYAQQVGQAWAQRLADRPINYLYTRRGVEKVLPDSGPGVPEPSGEQSGPYFLKVPILLRGQSLGTVSLRRDPDQPPWSKDEINVVEDSASQIASALENARLLEEINTRAQQEQLIGKISTKVQSSLNVETVLKTAVKEIGVALAASKVQILLGANEPLAETGEN